MTCLECGSPTEEEIDFCDSDCERKFRNSLLTT